MGSNRWFLQFCCPLSPVFEGIAAFHRGLSIENALNASSADKPPGAGTRVSQEKPRSH